MADETRESKIKDCQIQAFWQRFLKANPRNQYPLTYEDAWSFGDTPQMADELAALVLAGKKTATTSAAALYEIEQEALPQSGTYSVLLNGSDVPKAVLYLESVSIVPFDEVTAAFAFLEGEEIALWLIGAVFMKLFFDELMPQRGCLFTIKCCVFAKSFVSFIRKNKVMVFFGNQGNSFCLFEKGV